MKHKPVRSKKSKKSRPDKPKKKAVVRNAPEKAFVLVDTRDIFEKLRQDTKKIHAEPKPTPITPDMSLTELQKRAKKFGIPFGGLNQSELIYKLQKYMH